MTDAPASQLSDWRKFAHGSIEQLDRAATAWIDAWRHATEVFVYSSNPAHVYASGIMRKALDAAGANVTAFCDQAQKFAQANSSAECMKLQTEFIQSLIASMQRQSVGMIEPLGGSARQPKE